MDTNMAFHRKHRPKSMADYVGPRVKQTILGRFKNEAGYPQTILLHGPRGTGKTSAARLIAKEYHCLSKVDGHACGECEMCMEIEEKLIKTQVGVDCMGVREVDIASDSGKAALDEVLEDALVEPIYTKYKVLILDEFHMASRSGQNRLLKDLEEPPAHLVFILCTTDPEKVLPTVLSRCQLKIEVRRPTVDQLADRLLEICKIEGIRTSMEALKLIAKQSDRIIREALNLLEEVAREYGNTVTLASVREKIGNVASEVYMEYYKSANTSLEDILKFISKISGMDIPPKVFIKGLTRFTLDCIKIRYSIGIDEYQLDYIKAVKKFFGIYSSAEMDLLLQIVEYANKMVADDNTTAELLLVTTALRIGKVRLLNEGLASENIKAVKENDRSFKNYEQLLEEDAEKTRQIVHKDVDESLLVSVFGKNVTEVKGGVTIKKDAEASGDGGETDDNMLSDDELLGMFK